MCAYNYRQKIFFSLEIFNNLRKNVYIFALIWSKKKLEINLDESNQKRKNYKKYGVSADKIRIKKI